jgi:hypothetical protein
MGGGKGGGGSSVQVPTSPYESTMANIAQELYNNTANLRRGFLRDYESILGVGPGYTSGGTSGTGGGSPVTITGGGYIPNPDGTWSPFTADKSGYYADPTGKLYPGANVKQGGGGIFDQITGNTGAQYYYVDPATGDYVSGLSQTNLSPFPATMTGQGGGGYGTPGQASGRYDPTKLPTYAPLFGLQKQSLESQYQQARNNILASTPTGGNLAGALGNLENSRASTMGAMPAELSSGILGNMLDKAYGAAFNTPTQTLSGLGSAAGSYGSRAAAALASSAADQQSTYGLLGGVGSALGNVAGKALMSK